MSPCCSRPAPPAPARPRPSTATRSRPACASSPWTLGNADNTKNNDTGGATRRPKSGLNQADAVVSGEYAAKLGEQLTPYKGDTINQRTLSATPGKTYRLGLWATLGKSNDDTPSTLKVQVKSNLASLGAVSSFSQYRKTVLSETVDVESKEGGKIHYSGSFIVPLDVDPYAALWVAISQTDLASGSFVYIDNVTLVEDSTAVSDVASIAVTKQPTKTVYATGETFDLSGMVVTATMFDGTTAELGEGEYTGLRVRLVDRRRKDHHGDVRRRYLAYRHVQGDGEGGRAGRHRAAGDFRCG